MKPNLGSVDRLLRLVLGLALAAATLFSGLPVFADPLWFWTTLVVGAVLVATSALSFCPLYAILGASTRKAIR